MRYSGPKVSVTEFSNNRSYANSSKCNRFALLAAALVFLPTITVCAASGQVLKTRPPETPTLPSAVAPQKVQNNSIPLTVPAGTAVKIALDREVHIRKVGQPVHGKVIEPVYSFDHLVIPAGSEVLGKIVKIDEVNKKTRILAALNANFSPPHKVGVNFTEIVLPNGHDVPINAAVSPASSGVLNFVPAGSERKQSMVQQGKSQVAEMRSHVKHEWGKAKAEISAPGKTHKIERYALAQLPYHPQYLDPGTAFNADLKTPLQFGSETLKADKLTAIGTPPPSGSVVHAVLVTPLSSATAKKGDKVEAIITQPLVVSDKLFIPQGSHLKGVVLEARSARFFNRSGQLRIVFHQLVPPNGVEQQLEASLEGVAVANGEHLTLDSEGGAQVTPPKTRYLTTGLSLALASSSAFDSDAGKAAGSGGNDVGHGALNGAVGFKLVGTLMGALAHSRVVSSGLGFYGAGMGIYGHFLARGREVVYPKDMSMIVGFGARDDAAPQAGAAKTPKTASRASAKSNARAFRGK